jgi:hypothetical protein
LNLGDSYAASLGQRKATDAHGPKQATNIGANGVGSQHVAGLKPKDLVGIPWRVAFALQSDGWYLRSDIIWAKPNPMPESVTDRPTKAHEYVFLLTKSARYFYDADAVREPHTAPWKNGTSDTGYSFRADGKPAHLVDREYNEAGRNLRSVWSIATEPFPEAHFATFPKKLVEPCVKAGTSEKGCCPECGAAWVRQTSIEYVKSPVHGPGSVVGRHEETGANGWDGAGLPRVNKEVTTTGWRPTCSHKSEPVPCTVLDPFAGSGTVGVVALRLGRSFVGIELNPTYAEMARDRIRNDGPLFNVPAEVTP